MKRDGWWFAAALFCVLMLVVHVFAGMNSQGLPDFWRDFYWATAIAHGDAFPLAGPQIYQLIELGPWWFYLLALPIRLGANVAITMAFVQALAALKYPLAWQLGLRVRDTRFGLACAVSLAVAGWSTAGLVFPSHIALVETTLLLLAVASWRCARDLSWRNAALYGLAGAACLHAHPTTVTFIVASGIYLLWRHRSWAAFARLCFAAAIVGLSLLPPWLDRDAVTAGALKPLSGYLGEDIGVNPLLRIPVVGYGILAVGAWWGLLLMTPLALGAAKLAWWLYCGCLLLAICGYAALPRIEPGWRRIGALALVAFVAQIAFVVCLRPVTPVWMIPSCLPPLALAIAIGWYGWLSQAQAAARRAGIAALWIYAALVVAPYSLMLRDVTTVRAMPGVNPYYHAGEQSDRFIELQVPFYPLRRIDRLAVQLCEAQVLHGRLAAVVEPTFAAPLRNACGHWPALRYGGTEGDARHLAGLFAPAAEASGITPDRVVARMALYEHVLPIAPDSGGRSAPLQRLQIFPDSPTAAAESLFEFDAAAADAVVLTNRLPMQAPLTVHAVIADGRPARLRYDDGGSRVYVCDGCDANARAHWRITLYGVAANLDLVVLPHR